MDGSTGEAWPGERRGGCVSVARAGGQEEMEGKGGQGRLVGARKPAPTQTRGGNVETHVDVVANIGVGCEPTECRLAAVTVLCCMRNTTYVPTVMCFLRVNSIPV